MGQKITFTSIVQISNSYQIRNGSRNKIREIFVLYRRVKGFCSRLNATVKISYVISHLRFREAD